jgi:uncharacterized FlaG/YvyC family protein
MEIQAAMVNTQAMVNPQNIPNVVDKNAAGKLQVAQVNAPSVLKPELAPPPPDVAINREPVISTQELDVKIAQLNEAMASRNQAVIFSKDSATGKDVVRVSNKSTGELIRQMPSEEALKASQNIDQMMGLIFNHAS